MRLSEKMNGISTNVNLLRFVAAVFVIFSHSFYVSSSKEDPLSIFCNKQTSLGGIAVAIFFFLSGLYVTKSLYKKNDVKEYFYKRFIRIFPQLWVTVFLSVFVLGPIFTTYSFKQYILNRSTYLYLLNGFLIPVHNLPGVFTNNIYDAAVNGSLWTLPVEFAAYCALAIVLVTSKYILKNEKKQKYFHIICATTLMIVFVIMEMFVQNEFMVSVIRPMVVFFVGVLYCDYAEKIKLNIPVAIGMLLIMIFCCKIGFLNLVIILSLPYVVVTFSLGMKQIKFQKKILNISYEMYLLGWPIQQIVTGWFGGTMNPYLNWVIVLPIDILLAYAMFVFVERMERRKNKCQKLT